MVSPSKIEYRHRTRIYLGFSPNVCGEHLKYLVRDSLRAALSGTASSSVITDTRAGINHYCATPLSAGAHAVFKDTLDKAVQPQYFIPSVYRIPSFFLEGPVQLGQRQNRILASHLDGIAEVRNRDVSGSDVDRRIMWMNSRPTNWWYEYLWSEIPAFRRYLLSYPPILAYTMSGQTCWPGPPAGP